MSLNAVSSGAAATDSSTSSSTGGYDYADDAATAAVGTASGAALCQDSHDAYTTVAATPSSSCSSCSSRSELHWDALRDSILAFVRGDLGRYLGTNGRLDYLPFIEARVRDLVAPPSARLASLMALCAASTTPTTPTSTATTNASTTGHGGKSRVVQVLREAGLPLGAASFLTRHLLALASSCAPGHVLGPDLVQVLCPLVTTPTLVPVGVGGACLLDNDDRPICCADHGALYEIYQRDWAGAGNSTSTSSTSTSTSSGSDASSSDGVFIAKVLPLPGAAAPYVSRRIRPWLSLGHHRNIAQALMVRSLGDRAVIVTERAGSSRSSGVGGGGGGSVTRGNLADWMRMERHGRHPLSLFDAMISIAWGLDFAHASNCLHLNLKPENVLVDFDVAPGSSFVFKLTDFLLGHGSLSSYDYTDEHGRTTAEPHTTTTPSSSYSTSPGVVEAVGGGDAYAVEDIGIGSSAEGVDIDMKATVVLFIGIIRCRFLSDAERFQLLEASRTSNLKVINDVLRAALTDSPFPRAFLGAIRSLLWNCLTSTYTDTGFGAQELVLLLLKSFEDAFSTKYMADALLPSRQPRMKHHNNLMNLAIAEYNLGNYDFCMELCSLITESGGLVRGPDYMLCVLVLQWRCGRLTAIEVLNKLWATSDPSVLIMTAKPLEFFLCLVLKTAAASGTGTGTGLPTHTAVVPYVAAVLCEAGYLTRANAKNTLLDSTSMLPSYAIASYSKKQHKCFRFAKASLSSLHMSFQNASLESYSKDKSLVLNIGSSFQCMIGHDSFGQLMCESLPNRFPQCELGRSLPSMGKDAVFESNARGVWWSRDEAGDGVGVTRFISGNDKGLSDEGFHVNIGQFIVAGNIAVFAHVVIGVEVIDYVPSSAPRVHSFPSEDVSRDFIQFYFLVEGKNVSNNPFDKSSCDADETNSDTDAIQRAVTTFETSPGVENEIENQDGIDSTQLMEQHRPEYFLCRGVCSRDGYNVVMTDITEVRCIYPDQRPVLFRLLLPTTYAVVAGVGGLVAVFDTVSPRDVCNVRGNPSVTHVRTLSNDIQMQFHNDCAAHSSQGHSYQSCVIAAEYCATQGFVLSADEDGILCLWSNRKLSGITSHSSGHTPGGFELCSQLDMKSRINNVRISPSGSSAVVALADSLALVAISHENPSLHIYVRSLLDGPCAGLLPAYDFRYMGGHVEVWKAAVDNAHEDTVTLTYFVIDIDARTNPSNSIQLRNRKVATAQDADESMQQVARIVAESQEYIGDSSGAVHMLQKKRYSDTELRCSSELIEGVVSASFRVSNAISGRPVISPVISSNSELLKTCQLFCVSEEFGFRFSFLAKCIEEAHFVSSQQLKYSTYVRTLLPHFWSSNVAMASRNSISWHVAAGVIAVVAKSELSARSQINQNDCIQLWDGALNEKIAILHPLRGLDNGAETYSISCFCLSPDAQFVSVVLHDSISEQQMLVIFRVYDSKVILAKNLKFEGVIRKIMWVLDSRVLVLCSESPDHAELRCDSANTMRTDYVSTQSNLNSTEAPEQPTGWAAHRDRFLYALGLSSSQSHTNNGTTTERLSAACVSSQDSTHSAASSRDNSYALACISSSLIYFVDWEPNSAHGYQTSSDSIATDNSDVVDVESTDDSPPLSSPVTLVVPTVENYIDVFLSDVQSIRDIFTEYFPTRQSTVHQHRLWESDGWLVLSALLWLHSRRETDTIGIVNFEDDQDSKHHRLPNVVLDRFTAGDFLSFRCKSHFFVNSGCRIDEFSTLMYTVIQLMQTFKTNYLVAVLCSMIRHGLEDCKDFLSANKDSISGSETPPDRCITDTIGVFRSLSQRSANPSIDCDQSVKQEYVQFIASHFLLSIDNWQLDLLLEFPSSEGIIDSELFDTIRGYQEIHRDEFIIPKLECLSFQQLTEMLVLDPLNQLGSSATGVDDVPFQMFFPLFEKDSFYCASWSADDDSAILIDEFEIPSRIDHMSMSQDSITLAADSMSMIDNCSMDQSVDSCDDDAAGVLSWKHSLVEFCAALCRIALSHGFHITVLTDCSATSGLQHCLSEFGSPGNIAQLQIGPHSNYELESTLRAILPSVRSEASEAELLGCLSYIRSSGSSPQSLKGFWRYLATHSAISITDFSIRDFEENLFYSTMSYCFRSSTPGAEYKVWFKKVRDFLEVVCAINQAAPLELVASAIDLPIDEARSICSRYLTGAMYLSFTTHEVVLPFHPRLKAWLTKPDRAGEMFYVNLSNGHNALSALFLRHCGNKSIAVDHPWHDYLRLNGHMHLRRSTRALRDITSQIRKIDETCNIRGVIPYQIGFISGLQELYARRVGLCGRLPEEMGLLKQLRVLSMGNNRISGSLPKSLGGLENLQRIVLHQNRLSGEVPAEFEKLKCIINLAGNPRLVHGPDIPASERKALEDLYHATSGDGWICKSGWLSVDPVATWYKVGVLHSHVHSIVMSSNNMIGSLPSSISDLAQLRMIELATMPGLNGTISKQFCRLFNLRRLCICRCALRGSIPDEIGDLVQLEELQLFGNFLTGVIPDTIRNLTSLRLLSLGEYTGGNMFTPSPLPDCIAALHSLEALFIANCNVTGPLPSWICSLKELRQLDLQRNSLSGCLPQSISSLSNLLYLNVKDNSGLTGPLPVDELSKMTRLNRLSLVHCSFENVQESSAILQDRLPRCRIWV